MLRYPDALCPTRHLPAVTDYLDTKGWIIALDETSRCGQGGTWILARVKTTAMKACKSILCLRVTMDRVTRYDLWARVVLEIDVARGGDICMALEDIKLVTGL